jgi:hypothetical protein
MLPASTKLSPKTVIDEMVVLFGGGVVCAASGAAKVDAASTVVSSKAFSISSPLGSFLWLTHL